MVARVVRRDSSGQVLPGNQLARKPRMKPEELAGYRQQIRDFLSRMGWTERTLDLELGYDPDSHPTRNILRDRHPSQAYCERFAELLRLEAAGEIHPEPPWAPVLAFRPNEATVPLRKVLVEARQCPECVAEMVEGRRREADTWWWLRHPNTRLCDGHRRAWRRRRDWFHRCQVLGCRHVEAVDGLDPPAYTCRQETCLLRRRPWRQSV